jgi:hypothetical protein
MQRKTILISALALLTLALWIHPDAASAQSKAWDQAKVTELASQVAQEIKSMRAAMRKEPQVISAGTTSKQRTTALYLDTLKKLERSSAKLARQLATEQNREQTLGTARRIDSLLRDAEDQGAKLFSTEWTDKHLEPATALVGELRAYYEGAPAASPSH